MWRRRVRVVSLKGKAVLIFNSELGLVGFLISRPRLSSGESAEVGGARRSFTGMIQDS